MNKKERKEKLIQDMTNFVRTLSGALLYMVLIVVSGMTIFVFSNVYANNLSNNFSMQLLFGNFIIFGILFYSFFTHLDNN